MILVKYGLRRENSLKLSESESSKQTIACYTREILRRSGFNIKKNLGQNFLIDAHVLNKIINAAEITRDDLIIEVGPGLGGLTQELAVFAGHVAAIEIDSSLIPLLNQNLSGYKNIEIINADILKTDVKGLIAGSGYNRAKLVANLPYYITTPIIMGLLESKAPLDSLIVMVQKEVARRMCAGPGSKDYGSLSLAVDYYADAALVANVPQNCFIPRPTVDSAVIKLSLRSRGHVTPGDEGLMFKIIKAAFSMRRKTLVNCLHSTEFIGLPKLELGGLLEGCGLDANIRGEDLTLKNYSDLTNAMLKAIKA